MNLPADVARCVGVTHWEQASERHEPVLRVGCDTCKRRNAPPSNHPWQVNAAPPNLVDGKCPAYLG